MLIILVSRFVIHQIALWQPMKNAWSQGIFTVNGPFAVYDHIGTKTTLLESKLGHPKQSNLTQYYFVLDVTVGSLGSVQNMDPPFWTPIWTPFGSPSGPTFGPPSEPPFGPSSGPPFYSENVIF